MKHFLTLALLAFLSAGVFAQEYAWDELRPLTEFAKSIDLPIKIIVFLLAAAIFLIALLSYQKSKSKRILLVSIAFFFFALKWLVKILDLVYSPGSFLGDSSENIFELIILVSLLIALFYKRSPDGSARDSKR